MIGWMLAGLLVTLVCLVVAGIAVSYPPANRRPPKPRRPDLSNHAHVHDLPASRRPPAVGRAAVPGRHR